MRTNKKKKKKRNKVKLIKNMAIFRSPYTCFAVYCNSPRRGRGGSSEISPPLLRSSGLYKNLFYPPHLRSIFLSTAYFAISLLQTLTPFFQSLHYSFVPFIGVKLLVWAIYSLLCRVVLCIWCVMWLVNLLCRAYCTNIFCIGRLGAGQSLSTY